MPAKKKTTKKSSAKSNTRRNTAKRAVKQLSPRARLILLISVIIFAFIIVYSTITLIYRAGKTKTIIQFAPNAAKVSLNGTQVSNGATIWLAPGDYHLVVSYNEHLETHEEDITITNKDAEYYGTLSALDDEGNEYIEKHRQEYTKVEGMVGILLNRQGKENRSEHPILNYLPINNSLYSISYQYNDNKDLEIYVKSDPKYLDVAVAKMKLFENVDLEDQNIIFLNNNIFEKYQQNPITDAQKYIRAAYQLPSNYVVSEPHEIGDYTAATIYIKDDANNTTYAHYRVVLKKNDSSEWEIISTPQPLLTTRNTPNVDKKILKTINSY